MGILSNRDPLDTYMDLLEYENGFDADQIDRLKFYFHNCYIKELSQEQIDDYFEPNQRCLVPAARNILDTPFYLVLYRQAMQPSGKDAGRWITDAFQDHLNNGTPEKTTLMLQMLLREIDNLRSDITSAERELRCFINALIALSTESNVQVIVTTHSAVLVNALDFKNIRLICADGSQKRVEAVRSGQLPFPSLNEVNYLAFSEISEGYHDELYGYLEEQEWLNEYKQGKTTVPYKKISANGTTREQQICMTEYIRHQIHHPENTYNARFNDSQLRRSIEDMRAFVTSKAQTPETT